MRFRNLLLVAILGPVLALTVGGASSARLAPGTKSGFAPVIASVASPDASQTAVPSSEDRGASRRADRDGPQVNVLPAQAVDVTRAPADTAKQQSAWLCPDKRCVFSSPDPRIADGREYACVWAHDRCAFVSGDPKPDDVQQADDYPDCFVEAALAALAYTAPGRDLIRSMIRANDDGSSYTVTFPGDANSPVMVGEPEAERYHTKNSALWAQILERALLKYSGAPPDGTIADSAPASRTEPLLQLLTGYYVDQDDLLGHGADKAKVEHDIETALSQERPIEAGSRWNEYPLPSTHAFTIVGYDPKTVMVTMRNPWAENPSLERTGITSDGVEDLGKGYLRMPMLSFMAHFKFVYFANVMPPKPLQPDAKDLMRLDAGNPLSMCPNFDTVPESVWDAYISAARDPSSTVKKYSEAASSTNYTVENGSKRFFVTVDKGGNLSDRDSITMIADNKQDVTDWYSHGKRTGVSFHVDSKRDPNVYASVDVKLSSRSGTVYVVRASAYVNRWVTSGLIGKRIEDVGQYDARFTPDGAVAEYGTRKSINDSYQPTSCTVAVVAHQPPAEHGFWAGLSRVWHSIF